jgi:hypothetical protein
MTMGQFSLHAAARPAWGSWYRSNTGDGAADVLMRRVCATATLDHGTPSPEPAAEQLARGRSCWRGCAPAHGRWTGTEIPPRRIVRRPCACYRRMAPAAWPRPCPAHTDRNGSRVVHLLTAHHSSVCARHDHSERPALSSPKRPQRCCLPPRCSRRDRQVPTAGYRASSHVPGKAGDAFGPA